jgi:beta-glucosidase
MAAPQVPQAPTDTIAFYDSANAPGVNSTLTVNLQANTNALNLDPNASGPVSLTVVIPPAGVAVPSSFPSTVTMTGGTLNGVLRGQLGFKGFVTSDWGAVHHVADLLHGDNIEQPGNAAGTSIYGQQLLNALASGTSAVPATADYPAEPAHTAAEWKAAVDSSVLAILTEENNAGVLEGTQYGTHYDPATHAPYVPPRPDLDSLRPVAFAITQAIAEQSATLLKNDGALPLSHGDLSGNGKGNGVVVMGPTAIAPYIGGGGSAHVTPYDPVQGPYDALAAAAGGTANLTYVPGYDLDGHVVPSSALSAPDPAAGYPNWTLTPADAAFASQPGLLRQQITTDTVASGAQPALYTGPGPKLRAVGGSGSRAL